MTAKKKAAPKKSAIKKAIAKAKPKKEATLAEKLLPYVTAGCDKADINIRPVLDALMKPGQTAAQMAHSFVMLRRSFDRWSETAKMMEDTLNQLKLELVPQAFERENLTSFTLDLGYRVTVSQRYAASIKPEFKSEAYKWLRDNELGDLIVETVNAQTLSAAGKAMIEQGKELEEDYFNCAFIPGASVTKVAVKVK